MKRAKKSPYMPTVLPLSVQIALANPQVKFEKYLRKKGKNAGWLSYIC
jgi:hypothetical protein